MGFLVNSYIEFPDLTFTPASISGLISWYDFSDSSTITKDGSNLISQVDDKSGNGYNLVQATGGSKPLWVSSGQNSLDIGNFTSSKSMTADYGSDRSQPHTVAGAVKSPISSGSAQLNIYDTLANGSSGGGFANDDNGLMNIYSASPSLTIGESGYTDVWLTFCNIYGGSGDLRLNSVSKDSGNTGTTTWNGFTLSAHRDIANFGNILVGEVITYDSAISGSDLSDLESYLTDKWIP